MGYIIIVILLGWLIYGIAKAAKPKETNANAVQPQTVTVSVNVEDFDLANETEFPIVGMKYQRLPAKVFESFEVGYIEHDAKNKYSKYAIGVYNADHMLLGHIPESAGENEELYDAIQAHGGALGGRLIVHGEIYKGDTNWIGRIYVKDEYL